MKQPKNNNANNELPLLDDQFIKSWKEIKQKYPDAIIVMRQADFYSAFYDDAVIISEITGTELKDYFDKINICSFDLPGLDAVLHKLVKKGYRVAVCDQLETKANK